MAEDTKLESSSTDSTRRDSKDQSQKTSNKSKKTKRRPMPAESKSQVTALIVAAVILVVGIIALIPFSDTLGWGLDFGGGTSWTFTAEDADSAEEAAEMVAERLEYVGVDGVRVEATDDGEVIVSVPSNQDAEEIVLLSAQVGHFEFVNLDEISDPEAIAKIQAGTTGFTIDSEYYTAMFDGSQITDVEAGIYSYDYDEDTGEITYEYGLSVTLTDEATEIFAEVSAQLASVYGQIVVLYDGEVMTAPAVSEEISDGELTFSGDFGLVTALAMQASLENGELPTTLTYSSTAEVSSVLSGTTLVIVIVVIVAVIAVAAIALYAWARRAGLLILLATIVSCVFEIAGIGLISRFGYIEPTIGCMIAALLAPLVTLIISCESYSVIRSKVAGGLSARDSAMSVRKTLAKQVVIACVVLAVVGLIFVLIASDDADRGVGAAAIVAAVASPLAWLLVLVPSLRLAAAGPMRTNPSGWGLAKKQEVAS